MSADGSDQEIETKHSSTRRSGRAKKPRVLPEDEVEGKDQDFEEPFEGDSEEDEDFEETRPVRKKPAGRKSNAAPAAAAPKKGKAAAAAKAEVEDDEEDEDVDGDLEDEEEEDEEVEEGEEDEEDEDFDSEDEGKGEKGKKPKKKRAKNGDSEAQIDRIQYFPNASFVIAKKDKDNTNKVDLELWRIDGKCMLQKFVGYTDEKDSQLKFKSTNAYTGWSALDKDDYMNVNVIIDPSSTQSKVIVQVDADATQTDVDITVEDVK